jgi:hypothetical protein
VAFSVNPVTLWQIKPSFLLKQAQEISISFCNYSVFIILISIGYLNKTDIVLAVKMPIEM